LEVGDGVGDGNGGEEKERKERKEKLELRRCARRKQVQQG
jgi:hypothetical protein